MHVIICPQLADFDAIGAAVGLRRLQDGTQLVLAGSPTDAVREFLASYRPTIAWTDRHSLDPKAIRTLSIVAARSRDRLGNLAHWLELPQLDAIISYQHPPAGDIPALEPIVVAAGAISTAVVARLVAADRQPTAPEATLLALGIYAATASLTGEGTTPQDARAFGQTLAWGADLQAVRAPAASSRSPVARELMSAPVRTASSDMSVAAARQLLWRYGYSGLPIGTGDRLVGLIARRDLDLAIHYGLGQAPVADYMDRHWQPIAPTTPLEEIQQRLGASASGRLPVLKGDRLVGIVTGADVLRAVSPGAAAGDTPDLLPVLRDRLPAHLWELLGQIAAAARERGWHLYLVGGGVRDLLLAPPGVPLQLQDIDLVVDGFSQAVAVGAGVELANVLQARYPEARLEVHGEFQTAALSWPSTSPWGPLLVDIATARTEFYPHPAANPEVETSSIDRDLYRRDFTVNALALCLTAPQAGVLLDRFGGLQDLRSRQVRVLHANSFIEDPTRIYRAVRFAVRLGFALEPQTEAYIRTAVGSGVYETYRCQRGRAPALQTRLRAELKSVLQAPYWFEALQFLGQLGALSCLHPQLKPERPFSFWQQLQLIGRWVAALSALETQRGGGRTLSFWQLRLEALIANVPPSDRAGVACNLQLPAESVARLESLAVDREAIACVLGNPPQEPPLWWDRTRDGAPSQLARDRPYPSQVAGCLQQYKLPTLVLVGTGATTIVRQQIWQYLQNWAWVRPPLNGNDLRTLGYKPGPQFKEILALLLAATLDDRVNFHEEAATLVTTCYPRDCEST